MIITTRLSIIENKMNKRKSRRKKTTKIKPVKPTINERIALKVRRKRIIIFFVVIIAVLVYGYLRLTVEGYNYIQRLSRIFNNDTVAVAFFVGFLYAFRHTFRLNQPDIATITKCLLMLLSAYFSYHLLIDMYVPSFLAMAGGLGTVLGIQQTVSLGADVFFTKKKDISSRYRYLLHGIIVLGIVSALAIDITATFYNLVLSEGDDIRRQQMSETAFQMRAVEKVAKAIEEKSKADQEKAKVLDGLRQTRDYLNMRHVSTDYASDSTLASLDFSKLIDVVKMDTTREKKGRLELGFAQIVGEHRAAKMNFFFMILFSVSLTLTIAIMEIKEAIDDKKSGVKPVYKSVKLDQEGGNGNGNGKALKGTIEIVQGDSDESFQMTEMEAAIAEEMANIGSTGLTQAGISRKLGCSRAMISKTCKKFKIT